MERQENHYDYLMKFVIVGESRTGKTSLMRRYTENFYQDAYSQTIGVEFGVKTINVNGTNVKFQIWDTAGDERFRSITLSYYRGGHGFILMFDITDPSSFQKLRAALGHIREINHQSVLLVGNKSDRQSERRVTQEEAQLFADENGMEYIECSAKLTVNIDEIFQRLAQKIMIQNPISIRNPIRAPRHIHSYQDQLLVKQYQSNQDNPGRQNYNFLQMIAPLIVFLGLIIASFLIQL